MKMLAVLLAMTLATADKPVKVETWHDHAVDFSSHETFDFDYEDTSTTGTQRRGRPLTSQGRTRDAEMRAMVVAALEKRGYRHAPDDEVDFLVTCQFTPPQPPAGRRGGRRSGLTSTFSLTWGKSNDNAFYVELREPEQRLPIWRGTGSPVQVRKQPIAPRLAKAIDSVLSAFPPAPHTPPIDRDSTPSTPSPEPPTP